MAGAAARITVLASVGLPSPELCKFILRAVRPHFGPLQHHTFPPTRTSGDMSLDETHYDVAVLSTGLPQAIVAAALASAGLSVIHLDRNDYYADQWASLTLSELHRWSSLPPNSRISDVEISFPASGSRSEVPADLATLDRHYALSLAPTLLPATGPSIDTLIASKVSSYATFRLLEHTAVVGPTGPARVPSSKEDVFKSKRLSLIAKRKLMKLLLHVASDTWDVEFTEHPERADTPFVQYLAEVHRFEPDLIDAVAYGVALCTGPSDPTRPALERARAHLQSIGRYGNSAYLVGQYGGAGELAQGYCRAAAVKGAMYILDHQVKRLERTDAGSWQLEIEGIDQQVTADNLVASDEMLQSLLPTPVSTEETQIEDQTDIIRGLLVLDRPIDFETATRDPAASDTNASDGVTNQVTSETDEQPPETGLLVFPPGSLAGSNTHTALALMMGEGTFSCPKGQCKSFIFLSLRFRID